MPDLFKNHIVCFPKRWLKLIRTGTFCSAPMCRNIEQIANEEWKEWKKLFKRKQTLLTCHLSKKIQKKIVQSCVKVVIIVLENVPFVMN